MYLYAFLFYQMNLNGRYNDGKCDIVRFLFSVLTYWCIRTYHVAYCIRAYSREGVFGRKTNLFIANTAGYRQLVVC